MGKKKSGKYKPSLLFTAIMIVIGAWIVIPFLVLTWDHVARKKRASPLIDWCGEVKTAGQTIEVPAGTVAYDGPGSGAFVRLSGGEIRVRAGMPLLLDLKYRSCDRLVLVQYSGHCCLLCFDKEPNGIYTVRKRTIFDFGSE